MLSHLFSLEMLLLRLTCIYTRNTLRLDMGSGLGLGWGFSYFPLSLGTVWLNFLQRLTPYIHSYIHSCISGTYQARGIPNSATFIVGGDPQPEFVRSSRNIVGTKILAARVRRSEAEPRYDKIILSYGSIVSPTTLLDGRRSLVLIVLIVLKVFKYPPLSSNIPVFWVGAVRAAGAVNGIMKFPNTVHIVTHHYRLRGSATTSRPCFRHRTFEPNVGNPGDGVPECVIILANVYIMCAKPLQHVITNQGTVPYEVLVLVLGRARIRTHIISS